MNLTMIAMSSSTAKNPPNPPPALDLEELMPESYAGPPTFRVELGSVSAISATLSK
jgi:hypothetical protein